MPFRSQKIQLLWSDPQTGDRRDPLLSPPIALGREFEDMPSQWEGERVSRIVLNSSEVSRFHSLLVWDDDGLVVIDQNSRNGTFVNGQLQPRGVIQSGDILTLGSVAITIAFSGETIISEGRSSQIFFHPTTDLPDPNPPVLPTPSNFPPPIFAEQQVEVQDLYATGLPVDEIDYATVGGGLGSFIWVDVLRISGIKTEQITALGIDPIPYQRYQQLCLNSQIPLQERLRSNSDSCPDNIWGWPSYALREAWHNSRQGKMKDALKYLWQVFAEPTFIQTYTPRADNVFCSLDREAKRIGWENIFRYGSARAIRKTSDGRYAIAYSRTTNTDRSHAFLICRYLYLATGYPAIKFLPDLQKYRETTQDFKSVVNAYEPHNHIYEQLEKSGGTVLIRGRGIVASRIIQRLYEARQQNSQIRLIHLMRSPKSQGNKFGFSQRPVEHHFEFQPFNWPKACWGGELRFLLEQATPQQRQQLITAWGGTTTADRQDWREIVDRGLQQGWYKTEFGQVERVERSSERLLTHIHQKGFSGNLHLEADFIIDATGLDADVTASPLLKDLVNQYHLPLNPLGRLTVSNNFELVEMRGVRGQLYATGAITLGGPYAAVDSFLGLQYVALQVAEHLVLTRAPGLKSLTPLTSFCQWLKWVNNQSPH